MLKYNRCVWRRGTAILDDQGRPLWWEPLKQGGYLCTYCREETTKRRKSRLWGPRGQCFPGRYKVAFVAGVEAIRSTAGDKVREADESKIMRSLRRTLDLVWLKGKALGGFWVGEYDLGSIWPSGLLRREWSAGKEKRKLEEHGGPAAERAGDRCWRAVLAIHLMNSFTPSTSQPHQPSSDTSPDHTLHKAVLCLPASLFLWPHWLNNIHHYLQSPYLFVSFCSYFPCKNYNLQERGSPLSCVLSTQNNLRHIVSSH